MLWGKMLKAMEGICKPQFVIYKFLEETFLLVWFSLKSAVFSEKNGMYFLKRIFFRRIERELSKYWYEYSSGKPEY